MISLIRNKVLLISTQIIYFLAISASFASSLSTSNQTQIVIVNKTNLINSNNNNNKISNHNTTNVLYKMLINNNDDHQVNQKGNKNFKKSISPFEMNRRNILSHLSKIGREKEIKFEKISNHSDSIKKNSDLNLNMLSNKPIDTKSFIASSYLPDEAYYYDRKINQIQNTGEKSYTNLDEIDFNQNGNKNLNIGSHLFKDSSIANKLTKKKLSRILKQDKDESVSRGIGQIKSIYNNVKNGQILYDDKEINTIRYVPSIKVDLKKKIYFLFNLSLLTNSEKLIKSELYINKKYIRQKLAFNLYYFLYSTSKKNDNLDTLNETNSNNGPSMTIDLANFKSQKFKKQNGWQLFNIIDSLNSYLSVRNNMKTNLVKSKMNNNKLVYYTADDSYFDSSASTGDNSDNSYGDELVLIMESQDLNTRLNNRKLDKSFSDFMNPYLIIYSSESEGNMKKFFQNRIPSSISDELPESSSIKKLEKSSSIFNSLNPSNYPVNDDELEKLKQFENHVDQMNEKIPDEASSNSEEVQNSKTELYKNLAINKPNDYSFGKKKDFKTKFNKGLNLNSNNSSSLNKKQSNKTKNKSTSVDSNSIFYLPKSDDFSTFRGTMDKAQFDLFNKKKTKRDLSSNLIKRNKLLPSLDYDDMDSEEKLKPINEENNSFQSSNSFDLKLFTDFNESRIGNLNENKTKTEKYKCKTQTITVDFEDISFSEWIIEPKSYESNYCSGFCKFPLNKKTAYSNYATIQSILNSINLNNKNSPPELCCSPSVLETLPILYIDKNSIDYVVKLLPDMIVKECACR